MAHLRLEHVGLDFHVRTHGRISLKEYILKGMFRTRGSTSTTVRALDDISLDFSEGDRVGIIGHNGAGKSTLLKVLAGIYEPTHGTRVVNGKIASLFDITLGFEPEASGWENIAFRSYFQGETPRTLKAKMQAIADFSELGEFLEMPVRYYSAGMCVRLAFSIATAIETEILIVDEVLSAGDLAFQHKARKRIEDLLARARVVVLVSHDLGSVASLCERVIWMDHGHIRQEGPPSLVIPAYQAMASAAERKAA
ncbi:MAG: ABC transporter ATP-binding protein [Pirellulales bacterium]